MTDTPDTLMSEWGFAESDKMTLEDVLAELKEDGTCMYDGTRQLLCQLADTIRENERLRKFALNLCSEEELHQALVDSPRK